MKGLGSLIKELRLRRELTQSDLAERAGVTPNFISLVENGRRRPSLALLSQLAHELRVPEYCLQWHLTPKPPSMSERDEALYTAIEQLVNAAMRD